MTLGKTNVIPKPPMPWVIQMSKKGISVGSVNKAFICCRSSVLEFIDGACGGTSINIAFRSASVRNVAFSGSVKKISCEYSR